MVAFGVVVEDERFAFDGAPVRDGWRLGCNFLAAPAAHFVLTQALHALADGEVGEEAPVALLIEFEEDAE